MGRRLLRLPGKGRLGGGFYQGLDCTSKGPGSPAPARRAWIPLAPSSSENSEAQRAPLLAPPSSPAENQTADGRMVADREPAVSAGKLVRLPPSRPGVLGLVIAPRNPLQAQVMQPSHLLAPCFLLRQQHPQTLQGRAQGTLTLTGNQGRRSSSLIALFLTGESCLVKFGNIPLSDQERVRTRNPREVTWGQLTGPGSSPPAP